jgi:hypothetical protein
VAVAVTSLIGLQPVDTARLFNAGEGSVKLIAFNGNLKTSPTYDSSGFVYFFFFSFDLFGLYLLDQIEQV